MTIGPRVWKTGLAVVIAAYFGQILAPDWIFVAVVAAIISVQPTIGISLEKGIDRILGTLVGGVVGSIFYLFLGDHLVMIGLATIITIMICIHLEWQNAIVLACVIVVMIMMGSGGDDFIGYALNRILLTLFGVLTGFLINIGIYPPRPQDFLTKELMEIGESVEILYHNAILWFLSKDCHEPSKMESLIEKTRIRINHVKEMALSLKTEIGTRRIFFIRSRVKRFYLLYDLTVLINLIFERSLNIHQLATERALRVNKGPKSQEFKEMAMKVRQFLHVISGVQHNLLTYLSTEEGALPEIIRQQFLEFHEALLELHQSLDSWQSAHLEMKNIRSMMEITILAYELERIGEYQLRINDLVMDDRENLLKDERVDASSRKNTT